MDFKAAIDAHVAWKMKLTRYLRHPDGTLDPVSIAKDDGCELGKWLRGEGAKGCAHHPVFATLRSEHARFHKAAAEVVLKANHGATMTEDVAVGGTSPFAKASTAVVVSIMELRRLCS